MRSAQSLIEPSIQNQDNQAQRVTIRYDDIERDIRCIYLIGRLDILGVAQIESTFTTLASTEGKSVIVELSRVELMNSVGLGLLITNANTLADQGKVMVLLKPRPRIKRVIEIASIPELLPIEYDLNAALKR